MSEAANILPDGTLVPVDDEPLARDIVRACILGAQGHADSGSTMCANAIRHVDCISDDYARELWGFLGGLGVGLSAMGNAFGASIGVSVQKDTTDTDVMRDGIKRALAVMAGVPFPQTESA
jgi:hypothetical protein